MPYVGNIPAEKYAAFNVQYFTTSATATYTLDRAVANELDIRLVINNVIQEPGAGKAYTAAGTTLTLSAATAGSDTMYAVYIGKAVQTVNPGAGSVGTTALADNAVTEAKLNVSNSPTNGYVLSAQSGAAGGLTWAVDAGGAALTGSTDNTLVTVTGANAIQGEANATFDGTQLNVGGATDAGFNPLQLGNTSDSNSYIQMLGSVSGQIHFGDSTSGDGRYIGVLQYRHDTNSMFLKTNGATALEIDSAGRILKPLNVMFQAYSSSTQNIQSYADQDVVFGGEDFDIGSNFASNTFTAPIAGKYVFMVRLQIADAVSNWIKVKLVPSGKQYQWFWKTGNTDTMCEFSQIVDMAANDTAKVTIVADDNNYNIIGDSGSTYHQSTFSGYLLG